MCGCIGLKLSLIHIYASSSLGKEAGVAYRNMFGECNNYILDSLRGLKEVLLFKSGDERLKEINSKSYRINKSLDKIKEHEGIIRAVTDLTLSLIQIWKY